MTLLRYFACLFFLSFSASIVAETSYQHFPEGARNVYIPNVEGVRSRLLENIAPLVEQSIDRGLYPGAVILASHHGHIIYRGIFGNRRIVPDIAPMTFNTIFDLASLTKVIVTTTAIMQLVERGKLDLDAPVGCYWPQFSSSGKQNVTVRELLTHTSGFQADVNLPIIEQTLPETVQNECSKYGRMQILMTVEKQPLIHPPGTVFNYSDVNFIALGHLVEIITGEPLEAYAKKHIFEPLGMERTFFLPSSEMRNEIAPTQLKSGRLRWGEVHDNTAYFMGGVAGMAGLFSDANDLGIFAECLMKGGRIPGASNQKTKHLLGPLTILKMTSPQTPKDMPDIHGLGWDIDSRYSNRGVLFPIRSFGHTGWTGTSIWIDPNTQTWLIILTSRSHPRLSHVNQLIYDRKAIANIIAGSITDLSTLKIRNTGDGELTRAYKN